MNRILSITSRDTRLTRTSATHPIGYIPARDRVTCREAYRRLGISPDHIATRLPARPTTLSVSDAVPLVAPGLAWQTHGRAWVDECAACLWQSAEARARWVEEGFTQAVPQ